MSDTAQVVTADQLFTQADGERYELVRGVARVCEPPGGLHGRLAARIAARLSDHVERNGLGTVLVEAGYLLRQGPDTVRGPDVSFISAGRMAPDQIPDRFISGAPDLAIEILSPGSRWPEVHQLLAEYLGAGARMVWVVEPIQRRVTVHYPDRPPQSIAGESLLEGEDVVPGFSLATADLFGRA